VVHRGVHGAKILLNLAPMYIKVQTRTKVGTDGKKHSFVYPKLYESYRDCDGKIRRHYLIPLDLDIRPVYHQSDEAIKAHFNLAVLAYWVVSTTQYQLRRKGCKISWRKVKRIADTQVVVSTIAKRIDGNEVEVRLCTEPEQQLSDLYKKLEFTSPTVKMKAKNLCGTFFLKAKKSILENQRVRFL